METCTRFIDIRFVDLMRMVQFIERHRHHPEVAFGLVNTVLVAGIPHPPGTNDAESSLSLGSTRFPRVWNLRTTVVGARLDTDWRRTGHESAAA